MNRRPVPIAARALVTAALLAANAFLTGASSAQAPPRADILPASSVRPGMVGVGYTVFQGTKIDTFSVSILGVLRDYRPGGTLILARTENPYLLKTGIIAGMSGSPVYVDGRLIGAVSYTWGFLKEPMAGITPIEEMLDILPGPSGRPGGRDDLEIGSLGDSGAEGAAGSPGEERLARAGVLPPALADQGIRPIATPV
ncbi:MAG TPA: SpoIVB peptidase S55 domain-containing protein, partial [Acidobacteriota bacterium]|nr:SpoIVB peptidase S55 domain-containing protein [Acidobacteriota bacterium]